MKKVGLIYKRLLEKGGLERRLINYMTYFSNKGYHVTVFAGKKDPDLQLPPNVEFKKIEVGLIPKYFRQLFFAKKIKDIVPKYSFDICLSLGRTFYQKSIIDGGNHIGYMDCLGYRVKTLKDYMNIYLDKRAFEESEIIFACSEMVKDYNVQGFKTADEKVKILHPPINIEQFNQNLRNQRPKYRKEYELKEGVTTFLFISTGHKMKNLNFLLNLFRKLKGQDYELVIAGSPPKKKLPKNVRYLGYVKNPEKLYTAVDYTIHPALYEPYGQVIAESVQCGTPVILSKNVGAKEVITEREGLIVNSFSIDEWVKEIEGLKNRTFTIRKDFAIENGLTLEQHMQKILANC